MTARVVSKHSKMDGKRTKCLLGLFNGSPRIADCMSCASYEGKVRGLGDMVAKVTKSVGIKPCSACKKRQQMLNKVAPMPCKKCKQDAEDE